MSFSHALFDFIAVLSLVGWIVHIAREAHGRHWYRYRKPSRLEGPDPRCERSPDWNGAPTWRQR